MRMPRLHARKDTRVVADKAPSMWAGLCDCGTQSLMVMCTFDHDGSMSMYEMYGECSWCGKPWLLPTPPKEYV